MQYHFNCTQCGKCCHNLKLPLTVSEAMAWLTEGNQVQLICEAIPWPHEPSPDDLKAAHRRRRSFAALSGSLPTRVIVILAAHFVGACPHLQPDMRCGIYGRRPLVCRIYPAEINPFIALDPAKKACPPEAWAVDQPVFQQDQRVTDDVVRRDIQASRDADAADAEVKSRLCAALHVDCASVADEGFVVHSPAREALLAALSLAVRGGAAGAPLQAWRYVSNRSDTMETLARSGAVGRLVAGGESMPFQYLPFSSPMPLHIESGRPPV